MTKTDRNPLMMLAFLTAIASSVHIVESIISRGLPLPFLRLGLSNVVVLFLIMENKFWQAVLLNITKSLLGAIATFTLLTPGTVLSLGAGFTAILAMQLAKRSNMGFSIYGISLAGAIIHNLTQLVLIKWIVLDQPAVFMLTPILLLLGLVSGMIIARIATAIFPQIKELRLQNNEDIQE